MVRKLKKEQNLKRKWQRSVGVVIDCDEITISIFPPPREHGKPHCHVTSKRSYKSRRSRAEVYPELKVYLDGSGFDIVTHGFSEKDLETIGNIIFNDPKEGDISNDMYLLNLWETLHE